MKEEVRELKCLKCGHVLLRCTGNATITGLSNFKLECLGCGNKDNPIEIGILTEVLDV